LEIESLRVLFCFSNLTDLSLFLPFVFSLDELALSAMARAWPRIKILSLIDNSYTEDLSTLDDLPRVTLQGLRALAEHCPDLKYLGLALDASVVPKFGKEVGKRIRQMKLHGMNVAYSPISAPVSVARFISGIFPNVGDI
ncbi:hypothetical protein DFH09DRAFT_933844, partial [Mycena vulgaris]